jgi:hypothetical protein
MVVIGWILYGLAVLLVLRNAYHSFLSHRGLKILIVGGPYTVLAVLSLLANAAPWVMVIPVGVVDLTSWWFQKVARWPLG